MADLFVDVSVHNGTIDWTQVAKNGITGAIIRAGYGRDVSQKDKKFDENYKGAKAAGLKVGAYWYSYSINVADSKTEAEACLQAISGCEFDLPVFYDVEDSTMASYSKDTVSEMVNAFCGTIEGAGYYAGYYCNTNWYNNRLNPVKIPYSLWLADWRENSVELTKGIKKILHQFTSDGWVEGIESRVDMNYYYENTQENTGGNSEKIDSNCLTVIGNNVRMRREGYLDYNGANIIKTKNVGDLVSFIRDDGWGWSQVSDGVDVGWMANKYLSGRALSQYKYCQCSGDRVNVRCGPGLGYQVLRQLNKGNEFRMVSVDPNGWYCIIVEGVSGYGYIYKDYVKVF